MVEEDDNWEMEPEIEEAWRVEIERRSNEIRRGLVQPIPGDELMARLRRLLDGFVDFSLMPSRIRRDEEMRGCVDGGVD